MFLNLSHIWKPLNYKTFLSGSKLEAGPFPFFVDSREKSFVFIDSDNFVDRTRNSDESDKTLFIDNNILVESVDRNFESVDRNVENINRNAENIIRNAENINRNAEKRNQTSQIELCSRQSNPDHVDDRNWRFEASLDWRKRDRRQS